MRDKFFLGFLGSYGLDSDVAEPESSLSEVLFLPANV
jgi:hypothetical protein